ncbi:hypothetical protein GLOIN_2v1663487 [Rhizophagus irregularis DAOM 181602=DAOM 197198]|uniref:Uncharacterized protein n=1 Tax=Rhizophagus irregularis (strain DAOM 181602 / DAOM 197198 / MUCL 43194) TaxID=747089 RepID=A0A2P4PK39_RHIID|nr:hypothetical protein GLOIN_2v1663487 [Rhizophagus irregularis DAOM 181602=DAOM 197198]POG65756.1 hypothetical protein GLOIN_2v1663487 [Rhizophagus irregularis DAOM 181602=DAOM 197198]|eukprot:XP_025172622.1 hypothetical protein GLOIN_2v1663487 [Rhizophagus irregularis DAOM 181602=DAOM 197198]
MMFFDIVLFLQRTNDAYEYFNPKIKQPYLLPIKNVYPINIRDGVNFSGHSHA